MDHKLLILLKKESQIQTKSANIAKEYRYRKTSRQRGRRRSRSSSFLLLNSKEKGKLLVRYYHLYNKVGYMLKNYLSLPHVRRILSLSNFRRSSRLISKHRKFNYQKEDTSSKKESKSREKHSVKISEYKIYTADSDLEGEDYYKESEFNDIYITELDSEEARFTEKINLMKILKKDPVMAGSLPNALIGGGFPTPSIRN